MPDPFTPPAAPRPQDSLLDGLPGRPGFLFHDAFQPIYLAPPGLLGLVEGRLVIGRWKPRSLAWLDGTLHFFDHLLAEFEGEPSFVPVRRELEAIRDLDAPCPARNAFLFHYLGALTRDLERARLATRKGSTVVVRPDSDAALNGSWTVRYLSGDAWVERDVDVPGNWELLPGIDDYAGTMRFTRLFALPEGAGDGRAVSLRFGGADYFADVWLNGYHLGGHEGYFEPFSFDVSAYLRTGADVNVLRVAVTSPKDPSGPGTHVTSGWHDFSPTSAFPNRKTLVKGTLGHHDAKRGGAWSSITSQDGNTGGLWGDVGLRASDPVHVRPGSVRVTTMSTSHDRAGEGHRVSARTTLTVTNRTDATVPARIRLRVEPSNFDGAEHELVKTARLAPGDNDVVLSGTLSPVQLWNPADHGDPHLYRVTATVEAGGQARDTVTIETGFRTLVSEPDRRVDRRRRRLRGQRPRGVRPRHEHPPDVLAQRVLARTGRPRLRAAARRRVQRRAGPQPRRAQALLRAGEPQRVPGRADVPAPVDLRAVPRGVREHDHAAAGHGRPSGQRAVGGVVRGPQRA